MNRQYSVLKFESIIHEFDPWFNYRSTKYYVEHGFYEFLNWLDDTAWYPLGRMIGTSVFPGLMYTSGLIFHTLHLVGIPIHIRDVCVFLAPIFSSFTVIAMYLFTKELWNVRAGLIASMFISIAPGYISRSVAGSYDNEGLAIFLLVFTFYLWLKAYKSGSLTWSMLTTFFYWYMVTAWGGYVFIINMTPLHVFVLILMGKYNTNMYISYCTFYIMGLILAMQIPFVGMVALSSSEHLPALGVFGLLQIVAFTDYMKSLMKPNYFKLFLHYIVGSVITLGIVVLLVFEYTGIISPLTGRFYSLFDTGYAQVHIPIISSVAEHQPTSWTSYVLDLHFLAFAMVYGVYLCIEKNNEARIFAILYGLFASYFSGVMVRLMLTLTPIVCVLAAVAVSYSIDGMVSLETNRDRLDISDDLADNGGEKPSNSKSRKSNSAAVSNNGPQQKKPVLMKKKSYFTVSKRMVGVASLLIICLLLFHYVSHCIWMAKYHYSSPSVVFAVDRPDGSVYILDDFREAYYWLNRNTKPDAKILSWWDYGYQIAGFSNRTTLVDNNTWNNTHIATVGKAMASNETEAFKIFKKLDVDYVLIIFGGRVGYTGDDINKFLWMVRIAQGVYPNDIQETNYISKHGYTMGEHASKVMKQSVMYKTSYYGFNSNSFGNYDSARRIHIGNEPIVLETLEEAFTSENWIVRIYKVKDYDNRRIFGKNNQIRI
ncbi:dolichyl-diphosphooligosaccharide--protein glycosyltransferase subunit STT3B-like [Pempheris klunzingeri]|uniref:dolichyl-diphosphooligosaccharide--protein glycosyltransferase subunit STT3B-like n=1 Tax=Pempheris klunzingeri TaxID=3127111 RepID=UPI0039812AFA